MRRTMRLLAALVFSSNLVSSTASAGDSCASDCPLLSDLESAVETAPDDTDEPVSLPTGEIDASTLDNAINDIAEGSGSFFELLQLFADGEARTVSGEVFAELLEARGVDVNVLPMDLLEQMTSGDGYIDFTFDFGRRGEHQLKIPESELVVLNIDDEDDPYAADGRNDVTRTTTGGQTIVVQESVRFFVEDGQITAVREGDLVGKFLFFRAKIAMRSAFIPDRVATDKHGRPVLQTNEAGEPVVVDGQYVPVVRDDWIIIEAVGQETYAGIPKLELFEPDTNPMS